VSVEFKNPVPPVRRHTASLLRVQSVINAYWIKWCLLWDSHKNHTSIPSADNMPELLESSNSKQVVHLLCFKMLLVVAQSSGDAIEVNRIRWDWFPWL